MDGLHWLLAALALVGWVCAAYWRYWYGEALAWAEGLMGEKARRLRADGCTLTPLLEEYAALPAPPRRGKG